MAVAGWLNLTFLGVRYDVSPLASASADAYLSLSNSFFSVIWCFNLRLFILYRVIDLIVVGLGLKTSSGLNELYCLLLLSSEAISCILLPELS